jgi:hypothetical protein
MKRPPLVVVFVAVMMLALGESSAAFLSVLRPHVQRYALGRIAANAPAHGLTGAAEYDDEVRARAVFATEAGLSFLHTHAEGLPTMVLVAATLVATAVRSRRARAGLYTVMTVGTLFPFGWLIYALAVLERGRDAGSEFAETWVLAPLGSMIILALLGLLVALAARRGREDVA